MLDDLDELERMAQEVLPDEVPAAPQVPPPEKDCDGKVQLGWCRSVVGPLQKKCYLQKNGPLQVSPDPIFIDGEEFFRFNLQDDWLSKFLAGQCAYKHPLVQLRSLIP